MSHSRVLATVENEAWSKAENEADRVEKWAAGLMSEYNAADSEFKSINQIGANLTGNVEGRLVWLELLTAINQCLPSDPEDAKPEDISHRNELHITAIDCQKTDDLAAWFKVMNERGWYESPATSELDVTAPIALLAHPRERGGSRGDERGGGWSGERRRRHLRRGNRRPDQRRVDCPIDRLSLPQFRCRRACRAPSTFEIR